MKKRPKDTRVAVNGKAGRATNTAAKKSSAQSGKRNWSLKDGLGSKPKGGKHC